MRTIPTLIEKLILWDGTTVLVYRPLPAGNGLVGYIANPDGKITNQKYVVLNSEVVERVPMVRPVGATRLVESPR